MMLLIELSDYALYRIHQELELKLAGRVVEILPLLASVQDTERMRKIMSSWNPDTILLILINTMRI